LRGLDLTRPRDEPRETCELARRELALAALLCALGSALLFWSPLFGGRCTLSFELSDPRLDIPPWVQPAAPGAALEPINMLTPDIDLFVLPGMVRIRQLMAQGGSPWWDGGQLCGYPLEANLPSPIFLPTSWPSLLLDASRPSTGCCGCTRRSRRCWPGARRACWLLAAGRGRGGVGFPLTAWMFTRWHLPHIQYTTAWWPGLVVAAERLGRGQLVRGVAEGGLFLGLALLSGFRRSRWRWPPASRCSCSCARPTRVRARCSPRAAVALGVGARAAAARREQRGLHGVAARTDAARQATSRQGLRPGALAGVVFPEFFGRPSDFARPDPPAPTLQDWLPQRRFLSRDVQDNPVENALYPGVLVLLLAAAALRPRREPAAVIRRRWPRAARGAACCCSWPASRCSRACVAASARAAARPRRAGRRQHEAAARARRRLLALGRGARTAAAARRAAAGAARRGRAAAARVIAAPPAAAALDDPQAAAFAADLTGQATRQASSSRRACARCCSRRGARAGPGPRACCCSQTWPRSRWPSIPSRGSTSPSRDGRRSEALAERPGRVIVFGDQKLLPPTARRPAASTACSASRPWCRRASPSCSAASRAAASTPTTRASAIRCTHGREPLAPGARPARGRHRRARRSELAQRSGLTPLFEHEGERIAALERPGAGRAPSCAAARRSCRQGGAAGVAGRARLPDPRDRAARAGPGLSPPLPPSGAMVPVEREGAGVGGAHGRPDQQRLHVDAPFAGILVLSQGWDPGWSVDVDGQAASVLVADHALLGVALPRGSTK
jgi:hypothetical protein